MSLEDPRISELSHANERLTVELNKVRRQRDTAIHQQVAADKTIETLRRALDVVETVESARINPPVWLTKTSTAKNNATVVVMLSDTHFDEVVDPDEMDGLNKYDRKIATQRLELWAQNVIHLTRNYLSGVTYDGIVVMLGGDIFSGDIHEELAQTNEDSMLGSLLYWSEQISAAIDLFSQEFKKVHVMSVPGNHGRMSRKPRAKLRARTNFDWLLSKMLERHFNGKKNITFDVPDSADCLVNIYGWGHLLTHGDQTSGGGGIGGIWPPVMRLRARKLTRYSDVGRPFHTLWMGHWHQYISTPSLIVNGSMKGYDEYAMINNFGFEVPQQALAIITPQHNVTFQCPVFFSDRKKEKW